MSVSIKIIKEQRSKRSEEILAVSILDDEKVLLQRYSSKFNLQSWYFRILETQFIIEEGLELHISDIRDESIMSSSTIPTRKDILSLSILYRTSSTNIVSLWMKIRDIPIEEDLFPQLNLISGSRYFNSRNEVVTLLEDFDKVGERRVKKVRKFLEEINANEEHLKQFNYKDSPVKVLSSISSRNAYLIDGDIYDVFNSISTSKDIPFVTLKVGEDRLYKVFDESEYKPKVELEGEGGEDGIDIVIIGKSSEFSLHWNLDNSLDLINLSETTEDSSFIWEKFYQSLNGLEYNFFDKEPKVTRIKSSFDVEFPNFNKPIFLDVITNNRYVKNFLFLKENGEFSAMKKSQFHFYYKLGDSEVSIRLVSQCDDGKSILSFKIANGENIQQTYSVMRFISIALQIFKREVTSLKKFYGEFISFKEVKYKDWVPCKDKETKNIKTKESLLNLQREVPEIFKDSSYARSSSTAKQPLIVKDDELHKWLNGRSMSDVVGEIIRYPLYGDISRWYIANNKPGGKVMYPDLIITDENEYHFPSTKIKPLKNYKDYIESVERRKDLETPRVREFIKSLEKEKGIVVGSKVGVKKDVKLGTHILQFKNKIDQGRFGDLPRNIQYIADRSGIKRFEEGTGDHSRLLRYGVKKDGDSFFHCILTALDEEYRESSEEEKIKRVSLLKENLLKLPESSLNKRLRDILSGGSYIDPSDFHSLIEDYFGVEILSFIWNETDFHGEIFFPPREKLRLRGKGKEGDVVLLITYPKSTNLIVHRNSDNTDLTYKFNNKQLLVKKIKQLYDKCLGIRYTSTEIEEGEGKVSNRFNVPISSRIMDEITTFSLDSYGYIRVLHFGSVSVSVPPQPYYWTKTNQTIRYIKPSTIGEVKNLVEHLGVEIEERDEYGIWINFGEGNKGYVPLSDPENIEEDLEMVSHTREIPFKSSKLNRLQRNERVIEILKQYTEYAYAIGSYNFPHSYKISEEEYDLEGLKRRIEENPTFWSNEQILVPSLEIGKRLDYFLKTSLLNDRISLEMRREERLLRDFYKSPRDFRKVEGELVFNSRETILDWLDRKERRKGVKLHYTLDRAKKEPYHYINYNWGNRVVIIQNVILGDKERAIAVSKRWKDKNVNDGYEGEPLEEEEVEFSVYNDDGLIEGEEEEKVSIVHYGDEFYGAILPLV